MGAVKQYDHGQNFENEPILFDFDTAKYKNLKVLKLF